jgi:uncharacterized protein (TIGR03086 family)
MSQPIINQVTSLLQDFDARVQAADAGSWSNQSPCSEWTARDVVVHVGDNLLRLTGALQGAEATTIGPDDDIVQAWNQAHAGFVSVLDGADLSTAVPGPFGPMPAEQVIGRFVSTDVLVHTWDLARSVGGDEQINAEACAMAYSGLKPMDAMIRRPGVFGDKVEGTADDDVQTEFLRFLGRPV